MLKAIQATGTMFNAIRVWVFAMTILPTFSVWLTGFLEGLPWAVIIVLVMAALGLGVWLAYWSLRLWEMARGYFTSKAMQNRIRQQIDQYIAAGETMVDTPTAAAIWAGTMETGDIQRHLYFRILKLAVDNGTIKNVVLAPGQRHANKDTRIPLSELVAYLKLKGVLG